MGRVAIAVTSPFYTVDQGERAADTPHRSVTAQGSTRPHRRRGAETSSVRAGEIPLQLTVAPRPACAGAQLCCKSVICGHLACDQAGCFQERSSASQSRRGHVESVLHRLLAHVLRQGRQRTVKDQLREAVHHGPGRRLRKRAAGAGSRAPCTRPGRKHGAARGAPGRARSAQPHPKHWAASGALGRSRGTGPVPGHPAAPEARKGVGPAGSLRRGRPLQPACDARRPTPPGPAAPQPGNGPRATSSSPPRRP
jgi:hypothetical protein